MMYAKMAYLAAAYSAILTLMIQEKCWTFNMSVYVKYRGHGQERYIQEIQNMLNIWKSCSIIPNIPTLMEFKMFNGQENKACS